LLVKCEQRISRERQAYAAFYNNKKYLEKILQLGPGEDSDGAEEQLLESPKKKRARRSSAPRAGSN